MPGKKTMPPIGDSVASGNRMAEMEAAELRAMMARRRPTMPSIGDSVSSGNRMSRLEADEMRMMNEGPMSPTDMAMMRMYGKKGSRK